MGWTDDQIQGVWESGTKVPGVDENVWRKDKCTAWIHRPSYGDRNSLYGWEIDHINPKGPDHPGNLQPLHWKNNLEKSDGKMVCTVRSSGSKNIGL